MYVERFLFLQKSSPDVYGPVIARRGDAGTIWRPAHGRDVIGMAAIGEQSLARAGLPDLHSSIFARRGDVHPIRRPGEIAHSAVMGDIGKECLAGHWLPDIDPTRR